MWLACGPSQMSLLGATSQVEINVWIFKLCSHGVVSERFPNGQNENDENCKNYHRLKLVFVHRRGLCWFSFNCVNRSEVFSNNSK